jgi:hypothetical protein
MLEDGAYGVEGRCVLVLAVVVAGLEADFHCMGVGSVNIWMKKRIVTEGDERTCIKRITYKFVTQSEIKDFVYEVLIRTDSQCSRS